MSPIRRVFYLRWIGANALAEAVGLGGTLALGRAAGPRFVELRGAPSIVAAALAAVALGVVLEGLLVGWLQGRALARGLPAVPRAAWLRATALGAGLAWLVGMIPSTVIGLAQLSDAGSSAGAAASSAEPPALLQYALAALLGAVTGPILGLAQARVLRRLDPPVRGWALANAGAWALGMTLLFVGMDLLPWERGGAGLAAGVVLVCALVGAAVGAVHGRWLLAHVAPEGH